MHYEGGLWVAVGANGTILTSTTGTSWTSRSSDTTNDLWGVAYADGLWVAVGDVGSGLLPERRSGMILTSTTGTSAWTSRTSGKTSSLRGVAYADGLWLVVGNDGTILTARLILPES